MNKSLVEPYEGIHTFTFPKDVDYCNDLQDWIDTTKTNKGFEAEGWTESRTQMRSMTKEFKAKRLSDVLKHAVDLREKREPYTSIDIFDLVFSTLQLLSLRILL